MVKLIAGKKAIETKFLVEVIFAIIVGIIILVVVIGPTRESIGEKGFKDDLCRFNAAIANAIPTGGKWAMPYFFCYEKSVKVNAVNWDACDPDKKLGLESMSQNSKTNEDAKRECVAAQLYYLGKRCWYMFGNGNWDFGTDKSKRGCFNVNIVNMPGKIGETEITQMSRSIDECKYLQNDKEPCKEINKGKDNIDTGLIEIPIGSGIYHVCFNERTESVKDDAVEYQKDAC